MQEYSIMELIKWYIGMMLIMLLIALAVFFVQFNEVNGFKQYVNYEIERNGGLTSSVVSDIQEYSEDYYGGRFTIDSDKLNTKVGYGERVDYVITGTFKVIIFPLPDIVVNFGGSGTSQVR